MENMRKQRVLILINEKLSETDKNWYFFREKVAESIGEDVEVVMGELVSLVFELSAAGSKVYDSQKGWSVADFDLVVFRFIRQELALASSVAAFLQENHIPYIDSQIQPAPWSKFSAQAQRHSAGLSSISSFYARPIILKEYINNDQLPFAYPVIIKDNNGKKGRINFLARNRTEAMEILEANSDVDFIAQEFIENDGDYRLLVVGGKVKLAIHRKAQNDSHLNNTSQGATTVVVPVDQLSDVVRRDAVAAAQLEKLEVAGVDVMFDAHSGQHYILEVNSSPQLATGAVPEQKLAAYTEYLRELLPG